MSAFFSAVTGHFSRPLVLGTLLPVVLAVLLAAGVVLPVLPPEWQATVAPGKSVLDSRALVGAAAVLLAVGLLHHLNTPIVRVLEGYPWQHSWLGRTRAARHRARLERTSAEWAGLRIVSDVLPSDAPNRAAMRMRQARLGRAFNNDFPAVAGSVLPTRLGNAIRSFEDYPQRRYGMSAIPLWPRLVAVIDKDYAATIDEARSSFTFMVNVTALSAALALVTLAGGLIDPLHWRAHLMRWAFGTIGLVALAASAYGAAIGRAQNWGALVRGAFDLYRWRLLTQLGYVEAPSDVESERALWEAISRRIIFGDPPHGRAPTPPYAEPPTVVRAQGVTGLCVVRGIGPRDDTGATPTTIRVSRVAADDRRVADVCGAAIRVVDRLPAGTAYVWDSAAATVEHSLGQSQPRTVRLLRTAPCEFDLGPLEAGATLILTYRTLPTHVGSHDVPAARQE